MAEPPAKRLKTSLDNGASHLDVPGSPVDDLDDDFYETTPVKPAPLPVDAGDSLLSGADTAPASAGPSSLSIPGLGLPGLGLFSNAVNQGPVTHALSQGGVAPHNEDEELEDGELSDSEVLYNNVHSPKHDTANQVHAYGVLQQNDGPEVDLPTAALEELLTQTVAPDNATSKPEDGPATTSEALESKAGFLRAAEANKGNKNAEWELDSEASDSSSGSSSSDDSSDEADSDEGELLDPEEQVRRLMMESADDPGTAIKAKVKTLNEVAEVFEKPDITITEETKITELGKVESIVDNMILIKGNVSGNYQVLESGSALCLGNRTIIGKVSETIGRVQEPLYSVGFTDPAEIATLGITKESKIYYVNEHSTFVLTEPLRDMKFTDASNLHDEEANDAEFSDDEKEAEHKKKLKEAKRARTEANRDPQEKEVAKAQPFGHVDMPTVPQPSYYQGGGLNYSDDDEDLGMYKPLTRPDHFEDIVGAGAPLEDRSHVRRGNMRGGRGGWVDRGRGNRGRGGGGGGGGGQGGGRRGNQGNQFARGQPDRRGRQQEFNRGGRGNQNQNQHQNQHQNQNQNQNQHQQRENRSTSAASPNRQGRGRPQSQRSPPRGNKKRKGQHASPSARGSIPPTSANASGYAQNNSNSSNANSNNTWSAPNSNANVAQPQNSYPPTNSYAPATSYAAPNAYAPATSYPPAQSYAPTSSYTPTAAAAPAIPAGSYVNPAFYGQPAAPPVQQNQQQQQQNLAQWAQWFQAAAAMQNQGQAQPQPAAAPTADPRLGNQQAGAQNLQDILRALGGGQGR